MRITLNGQKKEIPSSQNLEETINQFSALERKSAILIAEVNGTIIKKNKWNEFNVNDGDIIELVSFVGGG